MSSCGDNAMEEFLSSLRCQCLFNPGNLPYPFLTWPPPSSSLLVPQWEISIRAFFWGHDHRWPLAGRDLLRLGSVLCCLLDKPENGSIGDHQMGSGSKQAKSDMLFFQLMSFLQDGKNNLHIAHKKKRLQPLPWHVSFLYVWNREFYANGGLLHCVSCYLQSELG